MTEPINLDTLERRLPDLFPSNWTPEGWELVKRDQERRIRALITELRAARIVVEAAQAYADRIETEAAAVEPWNAPEFDDGIRAALAAYEEATRG